MNIRRAGTAAVLTAVVATGVVAFTAAPASAMPNNNPTTCEAIGSLMDRYIARAEFWHTLAGIDNQLGRTAAAAHDADEAHFWYTAGDVEFRAGRNAGCWG
jgi:hypothetical protein